MRMILGALVATIALGVVACNKNTAAVDRGEGVTGTWALEVDVGRGPTHPELGLEQKGEELTGEYRGAFGIIPLTGTVKGRDIALGFTTNREGRDVTVQYVGTVDGDTMSGTVSMPLGTGTFTGTRK